MSEKCYLCGENSNRTSMKAFAQWIKALQTNQEDNNYFRKNTILQFGNNWNVIGAAILINPGSALPSEEVIDCETKSKLQEISNTFVEKGEWRVFNVDSTMRFLEKIFSGWYLGQRKRLEGVILLYNLFNIRCQDLNQALELRKAPTFKETEDMDTKPDEVTKLDVPIYIGWGKTGKTDLSENAQEIFDTISNRVSYYTGDDFNKALFYHPMYVNTSYHQTATQNLLRRFLRFEGELLPLLVINENIAGKILESVSAYIDKTNIIEHTQKTKLSFRLCDNDLTVAIVVQKSKQYIYWQHSKYDKRRNYRNFLSDYKYVPEIRDILKSYDYDVTFDSSLGEKALKYFAATNIEEISNMIWEEIQEVSQKINHIP